MQVTALEPLNRTKWKVELDGQFAFVLYKAELSRFGIKEGADVSKDVYAQIKKDVILKRAKLRAMHLLTDMARTERGLRDKLRQGLYTDDVVEQVIAYVKSFGYLDDYKYAEQFVYSRKSSKSEREIRALLMNKGVARDVIDRVFAEAGPDDGEQEAIRTLIRKRRVDPRTATEQELSRLYAYLARKGFHYEEICHVIQNYE